MITRVSFPSITTNYKKQKSVSPSFGFAKLNTTGREAANAFGYSENVFLDKDMFEKQGIFKKSAITRKLAAGGEFTEMCTIYGCTNNSKANAEFIRSQILSPKSKSALAKVEEADLTAGLTELYMHNYDNPELSTKHTSMLLKKLEGHMSANEYINNVGILHVGTSKKI